MKNLDIILCIAAAIAATSCAKELQNPAQNPMEGEQITLSATFSDAVVPVKTSLDGKSVLWSQNDAISVFGNENNSKFTISTLSSDRKTATFTGSGTPAETYYAVYPYSEANSFDAASGTLTVNLPNKQTAVAGGFADNVNLSAAISTDETLRFRNLGALVSFTMGNDNVEKVILRSIGSKKAAGEAQVNFTNGEPQITVSNKKVTDIITMTGNFVKGERYYFVVYPGEYKFDLTFVKKDGTVGITYNETKFTLERNDNLDLGVGALEKDFFGDLWLVGTADGGEEGQKMKLIYNDGDSYNLLNPDWNVGTGGPIYGPYYEIFTEIREGEKFYFTDKNGSFYYLDNSSKQNDKYKLDLPFTKTDSEEVASANKHACSAPAAGAGIYRLRINLRMLKSTTAQKISIVNIFKPYLGNEYNSANAFTYQGKGVWKLENFKIRCQIETDKDGDGTPEQYFDPRYRFVFKDQSNLAQPLGIVTDILGGDCPDNGTDLRYWAIQYSAAGDETALFSYPSYLIDEANDERYQASIVLNLSAENERGYYYHEFSDIVDTMAQ